MKRVFWQCKAVFHCISLSWHDIQIISLIYSPLGAHYQITCLHDTNLERWPFLRHRASLNHWPLIHGTAQHNPCFPGDQYGTLKLTHRGREKMVMILKTTKLYVFSWQQISISWFTFPKKCVPRSKTDNISAFSISWNNGLRRRGYKPLTEQKIPWLLTSYTKIHWVKLRLL